MANAPVTSQICSQLFISAKILIEEVGQRLSNPKNIFRFFLVENSAGISQAIDIAHSFECGGRQRLFTAALLC
jgi:hypothetical protein